MCLKELHPNKRSLMKTLSDNQATAIKKLQKFKVGALFMEPGTGKTLAAIELIKSIPDIDLVLWLTPYNTKDNLRLELNNWGFDARIYGIESLSNSDRLYVDLINMVSASKKPFVVVDESLKIKNWEAKRTRRIIEIGKHAEYKLVLNGTPLSRNILDIWAQMEFLSPKILKMSQARYTNTFCEVTRITKNGDSREFISGFHNVDHLYSIISHYVYECDLQIESRQYYFNIKYSIEDREDYNEIKEFFLSKIDDFNNNIFLQMVQKLQHSYCTAANKIQVLRSILTERDEKKTIIYAKFIESKDYLTKHFPNALILTYGKHSFGLNLQQYNTIIFWDKTWDYAQRLQATRRIYRLGQKDHCHYYDMTADVPLDTLIDINISNKVDLLDYFKGKSITQIQEVL